ncbi:MAG: hypothetical protein K6E83_06255 [Clostridium sp.]|nr:hypothetical protein [Clostridium sp.]
MKKVFGLILFVALICLAALSSADPMLYKSYNPDGTDLYSVDMDETYTLHLKGFSLANLSGVTYTL